VTTRLNSPKSNNFPLSEEVDLFVLALNIWKKKYFILKSLFLAFILAILYIMISPKQYESQSKLMPEYSNTSQNSASGLLERYGGLLGISNDTYNSSSNAIRVDLYPQIVSSLPFQLNIANTPFYFSELDSSLSLFIYYDSHKKPSVLDSFTKYTIGLPSLLFQQFKSEQKNASSSVNDAINLTRAEQSLIKKLSRNITAELDDETGIITVSARMDTPDLSAQVASHAVNELTSYLTDYRTEKIITDLDFIDQQLDEALLRFETAQQNLATFREQFQSNISVKNQTEQQRLNSEYQIAFNLYNTLTQKKEETKLKLQEETPLFKVLEPVKVPIDDEQNGLIILILFLLIGFTSSIAIILIQNFLKVTN
jgi:uncharacterized protein involved in exopolysaccharide biosynthesis